ncbi:MAG TPA: polyprenyl synthetase family protein [Dehalococcoidia bacterium]|nr:polyprenyl synthetase family protein [Dehalococcoidia bacterium]
MTTETLAARTDRYRPLVVAEMREVIGDGTAGLFDWMRYHLGWEDEAGQAVEARSGKLLRPTALLMAAELVGGSVTEVVPAAAAVELVHNFSLLHDDIEDQSLTRHGRSTVWTFAGPAQAINTGDGMFTLAHLAMHRLAVDERRMLEAMRELDETCLRLVEGQYLDISFETRQEVTRDEYIAMTGGKTAAMFAAPFAIGALLGGASGDRVAAFRDFGRHIGLAFQAVDDLLGIWGDSELTGKPAGDDLLSRKMTLPVVAALEADNDAAAELAKAYAVPAAEDEDIAALADLVARLGGRSATEAFAEEQVQAGLEALSAAGLDEAGDEACRGFAALVARRVF